MQGVDVQRVVASLITEDKQDIEDAVADIKPNSSGPGELEMNKRIMELNIGGDHRQQAKETDVGGITTSVNFHKVAVSRPNSFFFSIHNCLGKRKAS